MIRRRGSSHGGEEEEEPVSGSPSVQAKSPQTVVSSRRRRFRLKKWRSRLTCALPVTLICILTAFLFFSFWKRSIHVQRKAADSAAVRAVSGGSARCGYNVPAAKDEVVIIAEVHTPWDSLIFPSPGGRCSVPNLHTHCKKVSYCTPLGCSCCEFLVNAGILVLPPRGHLCG